MSFSAKLDLSTTMSILVALSLCALTFATWRCTRLTRRPLPFPPGPKRRPIIGNILDVTLSEPWMLATKWAENFGDLCYFKVFNQGVLIINSADVANDLLDRRGAIYSDKMQLIMIGDLCGCSEMVPFMSYGPAFSRRRALIKQTLGAKSIPNYFPLVATETRSFIQNILIDPSQYQRHLRRYAGGSILSVVYGYQATSHEDQFLLVAEECMDLLANKIATGLGVWPVDMFPPLKYLPSWFPGAGFKRNAAVWKAKMQQFADGPYEHARANWKAGTILPSFCSSIFDSGPLTDEAHLDLKWTANSMYSASMDNVITTMSHLILAILERPEVFKRARKDIDEVVGRGRLPTFSDRPLLPFIECILSEVWRWGVPVPLDLPHLVREDDTYRGYVIPKGTLVTANIWSMLRDESLYPNASEFRPERFENLSEEMSRKMNPRNFIFGFGRRRCPGHHLAESSVWLLVTTIIAALDIDKERDEFGIPIEPKISFDNAFFRVPSPFKFKVQLRPGTVI